ncbi:hypothetical protein PQX77_020910, partial [Marasmius sp. AFHP31]
MDVTGLLACIASIDKLVLINEAAGPIITHAHEVQIVTEQIALEDHYAFTAVPFQSPQSMNLKILLTMQHKAYGRPDAQQWKEVEKKELNSMEQKEWVYAYKHDDLGNIIKYKAKLVVQGFSQHLENMATHMHRLPDSLAFA